MSSRILSALENVISIDRTMIHVNMFLPWILRISDSHTPIQLEIQQTAASHGDHVEMRTTNLLTLYSLGTP